MAARKFSKEEVLEQIFADEEDKSEEEEPEVREDRQEESVDQWIDSFSDGKAFDLRFFRENARQVMLPIVRHSSLTLNGGNEDSKSRGMFVYSLKIN